MSRARLLEKRFANRATAAAHDDTGVDDGEFGGVSTSSTREHFESGVSARGANLKKRAAPLRRRGPLSEQLSTGKYAAVPTTSESSSSSSGRKGKRAKGQGKGGDEDFGEPDLDAVDDIFGMLDVPSDGDDDGEFRGAKTEEEMAELLEERMRQRAAGGKARRIDGASSGASAAERREQAKLMRQLKKQQKAAARERKRAAADDEDEDGEGDDDDQGEEEEEDDELELTDEALAVRAQKESDRDILAQVEQLRKRLAEERGGAPAAAAKMNVLDDEAGDGETADGAAADIAGTAQQLGRSFTALLHTRLKLQSLVSAAVRFPQFYALDAFLQESPSSSTLAPARSRLQKELRAALLDMIDIASGSSVTLRSAATTPEAEQQRRQLREQQLQRGDVDAVYEGYASKIEAPTRKRVDECVEAIGERVVMGPAAQRNKQDRVEQTPLLQQIRGVMSGLTRLYHRAQRNRAHATVLGHPLHAGGPDSAERKLLVAQGDVDPEIFDDFDFARELIQRSAAALKGAGSNAGSGGDALTAQLAEMPKSGTGQSRVQFHRKTKGRSVNYDPRPKLVGFMVPQPFDVSDAHRDALFRSIFS